MSYNTDEDSESSILVPILVGVVGFASGLGLGYFLGKRKKDEEGTFEPFTGPVEMIPEHLSEPKKVVIDEDVAKRKGVVTTVHDLSDLRTSMTDSDEEESDDTTVEEPVTVTVDTESLITEWDWETELESRTETAPYPIHEEEFVVNENNYTQHTLTYYSEDGVLADEDQQPIYRVDEVIGPLRWGHGSRDEDMFYVRNDELKAEYELIRVESWYALEVLGQDVHNQAEDTDLRHSKHMKFRME